MKAKTSHELYWIHASMLGRCYTVTSTSYPRYGARGITVCERWRGEDGFEHFIEDMGARPSKNHQLDRVDTNDGYSPDNCRWVTPKENSTNRRSTKWVEYDGKVKTITDWASEVGIEVRTLHRRIYIYKWTVEQALTTPVIKGGIKKKLLDEKIKAFYS